MITKYLEEKIKLLKNWWEIKIWIEKKERGEFFVNEREIWNINLGNNIWFESNWKDWNFKRPVLVIKVVWSVFFIATMTTKWKNNKFYYKLDNKYFNKDSYITLSQVKIIDKKRFIEKIWMIDKNDFLEIKKELSKILL